MEEQATRSLNQDNEPWAVKVEGGTGVNTPKECSSRSWKGQGQDTSLETLDGE